MATVAVISATLSVTLSKAISLVEGQIDQKWSFKEELNNLRDSLTLTRSFLQDVETRQVDDQPVQDWLKQLREFAHKADDVLDELAYEDLRRKVETQMRKKVCNFFSISKNPFLFCFKMAQTVKGLNISLKGINDRALGFGLQQRVQTLPPSSSGTQTTHAFVGSSQVVGRKSDVSKIIDLLIGSSTQQTFSTVSIVGMGGLGKTTLAKSVCKHERIKIHFNKIMWVCVSEKFDVERILQEMFESLTGQTCVLKNRNAMLEKIQNVLKGKTYLLVLDDVWDEDLKTWEDLRDNLSEINENEQSSILVTTRSENVAVVKDTPYENRYYPMIMKDNECWDIIKNKAFQNHYSIPSELEVIGREIARKCAGLPLVANVIGGTMRNKKDINEWVSLRDSSVLGSLEKNEDIMRILKLSLDRLSSPSLKQCFVYCSIFPKDFMIQKEPLIQLWMAEGFLQQTRGKVFEEIGNEYFNNLLSNSLLQDVEMDLHGCITGCKMHDLVHDFALSIRNSETHNTSRIQRLNEFDDMKLQYSFFEPGLFDTVVDFKGLRVINICHRKVFSLPESIGRLKHLRYFDISGSFIDRLPKSFSRLYHLQTLRLLRCYSLEKLPKGMKNLVSLRHLYISYTRHVPGEIGCLRNLRTLPMFRVDTKPRHGIGELGSLSELEGELALYNLENVRNKGEARGAKIGDKKNLHALEFYWNSAGTEGNSDDEGEREFYSSRNAGRGDYMRNDEEVLEGLEPHSNLKRLTIRDYNGEQNPSWLVRKSGVSDTSSASFQPINLEELNLLGCRNLKNLPNLGQCPTLKFLKLSGLLNVRCIGNEFYVNDKSGDSSGNITLFPAMEKFSLDSMFEVKEWLNAEPTISVFPSLKELTIEKCHNLRCIPVMRRFSSLETLTIKDCKNLLLIGDGLLPSSLKRLEIELCDKLGCIPSVEGGISFLQVLHMSGCGRLSKIEEGLLASTCLREVEIEYCPNLVSISSIEGCSSLLSLRLVGCRRLTSLPSGLRTCTSLEIITIKGCRKLKLMGDGLLPFSLRELKIEDCRKLRSIPSVEGGISFLQHLDVQGCNKLIKIEEGLLTSTCLRVISISDCPNLTSIALEPAGCKSLWMLELQRCEKLREIGGGLVASTRLENFCINRCPNLFCIPNLDGFPSLYSLDLCYCGGLTSLPSGLTSCASLKFLTISGWTNLKSIPEEIGQLHSLIHLDITRCQNLKYLPEEILGCLTRLKMLKLGGFSEELEEFPGLGSVHLLLEELTLVGWENLSCLPHQLQHLTALKRLEIESFNGGKVLPEWMGNLSSLGSLFIEDCENLEHLPSEEAIQRLSNLKYLSIRNCPQLKENSVEQSKISRIPLLGGDLEREE